jgi:hypothetical protein
MFARPVYSGIGLLDCEAVQSYVIINIQRKVLTPLSVLTLRKFGIDRQTAWHQNRKVNYPNIITSLNSEGEIVTFILAQNCILWWVLLQYDDKHVSIILCEIF